nr:MAG TPA: hypothetical protein [Caudoviricetes sp.]
MYGKCTDNMLINRVIMLMSKDKEMWLMGYSQTNS